MKDAMKRPTGETGGGDVSNKGVRTNVTDTYGANLESGDSGRTKMGGAAKSDDYKRNVPLPAYKGKA